MRNCWDVVKVLYLDESKQRDSQTENMKRKKQIIAKLISIIPTSTLRTFAYRAAFGYKIVKTKIGFGTIIQVRQADLFHCSIGRFNKFIGPMSVIIKKNSNIGSNNKFRCGDWTMEDMFRYADYKRSIELRENTRITDNHYFDIAGSFTLGQGSWIAGYGSQFWTHDPSTHTPLSTDRDIYIGDQCYIGSAVRFSPGSGITNNILVGLGSVVTKKISCDYSMIGGVPAKIIKKNYDWKRRE